VPLGAVQDGGEDVRLVDADKQLEWVDCMKPIHGIGLEPVVAVETVCDLIKGAPTIDAIPVEWLEKYTAVGVTPRGDRLTEGKERLIVQRILNDWQKEQEAR
jgi:hypothetical protein